MPSPPFSFTNRRARRKMFGVSLLEAPASYGSNTPPTNAPAYWTPQMAAWSYFYPNLYYPQMQMAAAAGANVVRLFVGLDGVLSGAFSQSFVEANLQQIIADCRTLGLTLGVTSLGNNGYSLITSDANWRSLYPPILSSVINDVLNPNADVIAYIEAGMQETPSDSTSVSLSNYLASVAKPLTNIPVLISAIGLDSIPSFSGNAAVDMVSLHNYPGFDPTIAGTMSRLQTALQRAAGRSVLIEETNINTSNYQQKSDFYEALFRGSYDHPDCAGVMLWAGFGPSADGDWTIEEPPASQPNYGSNAIYTATVASQKWASFGPVNKPMTLAFGVASAALTSTPAQIPFEIDLNSAANPSETLSSVQTHLLEATVCSVRGTVTMGGFAASSFSLSLLAQDTVNGGAPVILGSATVPGGATTAVSLSGSIPLASDWEIYMQAATASGSNASIVGMEATFTLGSGAPPPTTSLSLARPLVRHLDVALVSAG